MATAIFNCKKCKVGKRISYPEMRKVHEGYGRYSYVRFRICPTNGRQIKPTEESTCDQCGRFMPFGWLQGFKSETVKCDARCTNARGFMCECSCAGENHGKGWSQLGAPMRTILNAA